MSSIIGYTPLTPEQVETVNKYKQLEMDLIKEIVELTGANPRWKSIARTHFEQAFMALNRSIMRPDEQ